MKKALALMVTLAVILAATPTWAVQITLGDIITAGAVILGGKELSRGDKTEVKSPEYGHRPYIGQIRPEDFNVWVGIDPQYCNLDGWGGNVQMMIADFQELCVNSNKVGVVVMGADYDYVTAYQQQVVQSGNYDPSLVNRAAAGKMIPATDVYKIIGETSVSTGQQSGGIAARHGDVQAGKIRKVAKVTLNLIGIYRIG